MQVHPWIADLHIDEADRRDWAREVRWHWYHLTPTMLDNPEEPLTTNRFLWDLTRCIT